MAYAGQSVHVACAFSIVEICSVLYSQFLQPEQCPSQATEREYLILSKGHGVMALYACFRELGWLTDDDLDNYFQDGTHLRGLCEADVPGCEVTSGSLGHGLPIAAGIALGLKRRGSPHRVFCIVGDGEMNEGVMWEAVLFAAHHKLDNLTVIIDQNNFQAMGRTDEVLAIDPFSPKFEAFGWSVRECDGHDVGQLASAITELVNTQGQPGVLVAQTIKGFGVSFIKDDNQWHYLRLSEDTYARALKELETI